MAMTVDDHLAARGVHRGERRPNWLTKMKSRNRCDFNSGVDERHALASARGDRRARAAASSMRRPV